MNGLLETPEHDAITFAEKVFALLDETRYATTYKLAVMLGLMDLCLENTSERGSPPETITTRQLAEKVTEIYWPHTLPYEAQKVLKQASTGQAEILSCIEKFRALLSDGSAPLIKARIRNMGAYRKLVDQIEWKLIEMPLPRLQIIGTSSDPFIYQINWDRNIQLASVLRYQRGLGGFDNRIF